MYIVDDPTLALITRFVGDSSHSEDSDTAFLRQQGATIEAYVERFPADEREARALQWIEANAMAYRRQSQKRAAIDVLANRRCPDCPLSGGDECTQCAIHDRWLTLLRSYAADEISSQDYVKKALALLTAHKEQLKVGQARKPPWFARPAASCRA